MKTAYCLQHVPFEGPGVFAAALADAGYELTRRVVPTEGLPPNPGDFLLVMGGPMSANDPDRWIQNELAFIRRAVEAGVPYLGVCLGSQLLAKAMGGRVYKGPAVEIGFTRIVPTDAGRNDPLFAGAPEPLDVFEWHGEGIDLPPGAVALASSRHFPVQAFRGCPRAAGLLFHIEVETDGIAALCRNCPDDLARGGADAAAVQREATRYLPNLHRWARRMISAL